MKTEAIPGSPFPLRRSKVPPGPSSFPVLTLTRVPHRTLPVMRSAACLALGLTFLLVGCSTDDNGPAPIEPVAAAAPIVPAGETDLVKEAELAAAAARAEAAALAAAAEVARVEAERVAAEQAAAKAAADKAAAAARAAKKKASAGSDMEAASRALYAETGMTSVHPEECKIVLAEDGGGPMYDYCKAAARQ